MSYVSALKNSSFLTLLNMVTLSVAYKSSESFRQIFMSIAFDSSPNDKTFDATKLKAFADDKINIAQMMISIFDMLENILGKGENAGYQHFLLFPQCLQKASFLGVAKSQDRLCGKE